MKAQQQPKSEPEPQISQQKSDEDRVRTLEKPATNRTPEKETLSQHLAEEWNKFAHESITIFFNAGKWIIAAGIGWLVIEAFKVTSGYYVPNADPSLQIIFRIAEQVDIIGSLSGFVVWDTLGLKDLFKNDQDGRGQS